jgi:hypothetical protein
MMQTLFAWLLVLAIIAAAYPWSSWLIARTTQPDRLLTLLVTLALSIGALTLLLFWESILGFSFNLWGITLPYFALMLPGFWLWMRSAPTQSIASAESSPSLSRFALALLALICAAVLFNAAYWPFYRDDTLGIYHKYGLLMYQAGALVPFAGRDDAFYQAYPMQLPLIYTYSYLASGWVNEYLGKTIATLLSLACLPAAYLLGRLLYGSLAGWLAVLLLALMPTFARWSSSGYVDLPMAFDYTLAAIFAWRLWTNRNPTDAFLLGITIGFAAWTKNAAFVGLSCAVLWLGYAWLRRSIRLSDILVVFGSLALVAAPWYIRNFLEAGLVVPPTAWTDQAQPTLANLVVFITQPDNFALSGWIIVAVIAWEFFQIIRRRSNAESHRLLLVWTIPFFIFWWLLASYDPRFVLLFLPPLTVLAGGLLADLWKMLGINWRSRLRLSVAAIALLLTLYVAWISVEYKDEILRDPLMSDASKHEIVLVSK